MVTVTNRFAVPLVVHSIHLPGDAAKIFATGKFEPRVGLLGCVAICGSAKIRIILSSIPDPLLNLRRIL